jgi:transposase
MASINLRDDQWERIEHLLPGKRGDRGRAAADNRLFVKAVLWIARSGAPWRDLPEESLDASLCIAGHDRAGLERLLRECARPPFALERIEQVPARNGEGQVVYRLPKPRRDGRTALSRAPLELIDRRAGTATATVVCWHPRRRCASPPPAPTGERPRR